MTNPNPEEIEDLLSPSVERLSELLNMLYPDPDPDTAEPHENAPLFNPIILTLTSFKWRYRLTGLGPLAVTAIEQAQRITRDIGHFEDIGLCEFHIGLIYLHSQNYHGAAQQFREAWQQWSFVDKTAAIRLAYLAEGIAQHHAHAYEAALSLYGKAEQMKRRIHLEPSPDSRDAFLEKLNDYLESLQKAARLSLEKQTTPKEKTAPPVNQIVAPTPHKDIPIPGHNHIDEKYVWYHAQIQHPDNLFEEIYRDGYLLINTQSRLHNFKKNELIVVKSDIQDVSITLKPYPTQENQTQPRIVLARTQFEGPFTREGGIIQLTAESTQTPAPEHIFGYVVGLWLEAE